MKLIHDIFRNHRACPDLKAKWDPSVRLDRPATKDSKVNPERKVHPAQKDVLDRSDHRDLPALRATR